VSRVHLRHRVLLLTAAFAAALFAITFGLSFRARRAQERWTRLIAVEAEAVSMLSEVIRAQNAFRTQTPMTAERYRAVEQLLEAPVFRSIDTAVLRAEVSAFRVLLEDGALPGELDAVHRRVVLEAQRLGDVHRREIAQQLPELKRESRWMSISGLAVAWIVVMISFAVAKTTLDRVVRPVEELATAADRIAAGDLAAKAPVGGDYEIAHLGLAFNRMAEELKSRARTDDLTGLPNFRAFRERIDSEIERGARYGEIFGILVLDLDRFKHYNDRYGHLAGNVALQRVATVLRSMLRAVDLPARYGGEEFAVVVPQIDPASLARLAERIRSTVEAMPAPPDGAVVTVSIGAALYPSDGAKAEALFHAADERLYQAKREGRNRVVVPPTPARAAQSTG
jgi:diguanylate cyclase (GGDEF)-like protein